MYETRTDSPSHPPNRSRRTGGAGATARVGLTALLAGLTTLGTLVLAGAAPASASTIGGSAALASPGTATTLPSGASITPFTVSLPSQAACDSDTASHGYHVYSYLVPQGTSLSGVTFEGFPSTGFGLVDNTGTYFGPANTAIGTGQIVSIPNNFQWGPLVSDGGLTLSQLLYTGSGKKASGIWEAGLACADTHGALADNWNTQVTFTASATDPNKFVWAAVPGMAIVTTSLSPGTATIGTPYDASISVVGGVTPYKWKVTAGALPKGLKLSATTGVISGTVKVSKHAPPPGPYTFTVTVTDHTKKVKSTATATYTLTLSA
jgi:hypothetical protein